ncbi:B-cell receptor CD22-like [Uloborus diversus]|uniref:B-cell receptor CD22-like n=1 Tax=Uloborus diversus TaxID=327109 RepID=UPI00240A5BBC|nr:B-cell receptor CD22-like [Uloborus diversus]
MDGVEIVSKETPDGSSEVVSSVKLVLSRWDLEGRLECRVESEAVPTPMLIWVKLDVHVKPISLRVRGPTTPVVAGEMVSLTCTVEGARPPSDIKWFNRSLEVMPQPPASRDLMSDATWRTSSTLVFIASRHDHQGEFRCQGGNDVQRHLEKDPLLHAVMLDVLYPPFVSAEPSRGLSVNESGEAILNCSFSANPPNVTEIAWYKNGVPQSFSAATSTPSSLLTLKNISRKDAGSYSCHVRNAFGRGNSSNSINLNVLYPPEVNISVHPAVATEQSNVVLSCQPTNGNPLVLISVQWYHNGKLLADQSTGDSQLTIQNLTRHQSGKYACRGQNSAGWSHNSKPQFLDIHYPPGPAQLTLNELTPLKGGSISLFCQMEDPVAPTFVRPLPAVSGAPRNASSVRLVCHVECTPLCNISWYRDGQPLQDSKFFVQENLSLEEDRKRNLLPSIVGSLSWSPSHLPHSRFDSSTFSCRSSENTVGPGVNSSTIFRIEHAPEDVRLSSASMEVTEGEHAPREVTCTASAHPPGHFLWTRGDSVVSHSSSLRLNASREMAGNYSCTVWNEHGRMSKRFEFRVKRKSLASIDSPFIQSVDGQSSKADLIDAML